MSTTKYRLTIHMVSSLDGYVARKDNSVSWFETSDFYENGVQLTEEATKEFLKSIDCYVMGSRTYEHAEELSKSYGWAYGDVPTIVLTGRKLPIDRPNIETYSGDLSTLVNERLRPRYENVWVVGGPAVAKGFIQQKLADEIRISVLPILLGEGTRFFDHLEQEHPLHLTNVTAYKSGIVELSYELKKN